MDPFNSTLITHVDKVSARINKKHGVFHHTTASALAVEHELKVNLMTAGETLGEAILTEDGIRKASCVTEEPSEILVLNRKHFDSTFHLFLDKIKKEKNEFLRGFDFLLNWENSQLDSLAQICRQKTYHAGDIIIKQVRRFAVFCDAFHNEFLQYVSLASFLMS